MQWQPHTELSYALSYWDASRNLRELIFDTQHNCVKSSRLTSSYKFGKVSSHLSNRQESKNVIVILGETFWRFFSTWLMNEMKVPLLPKKLITLFSSTDSCCQTITHPKLNNTTGLTSILIIIPGLCQTSLMNTDGAASISWRVFQRRWLQRRR